MSRDYRINIAEPGPRPPYYRVAEHLWGVGCNIDSDGNSQAPEDTQWTALTVELRGATEQRVDIDPLSTEPLILQVRAPSMQLAQEVAKFIVECSGGKVQPNRTTTSALRSSATSWTNGWPNGKSTRLQLVSFT